MIDAKLRLEDLTSEERAILEDAVSRHAFFDSDGNLVERDEWTWCYKSGLERIAAMRALFAPAPVEAEKVETHICAECGKEFEEEAIRYGQATLPTPAQPAPVEDCGIDNHDFFHGNCQVCGLNVNPHTKPEPVEAEMPEAECALLALARDRYNVLICSGFMDSARTWRNAIEEFTKDGRWWRNSAQLSSVRSRERLIGQSEALAYGQRVVDEVIAAQPVAYKMPEDLRRWAWRAVEMLRVGQSNAEDKDGKAGGRLFMESADELAAAIRNHPRLQAHEGKGEGRG